MKVLVTGVSGFIGKNFLKLAPEDIEIVGIYNRSKDIVDFAKERKNCTFHQCDLTDGNSVKKLFSKIGNEFDYCLYFASNVNIPLAHKNPAEDLKQNVTALINFLEQVKIKRFVYMSSAAVYDGNEGTVTPKTKLMPTVPYAISKMTAEEYVKFFQKIGNIENYTILRFGGAFGPYSEHKFMTKLVREVAIEKKDEIEIYGDGTNSINVMFVNDTIAALVTALKSDKKNKVCNLGLINMTIKESVEKVAKAFDRDITIKTTPKIKEQKYIGFEYESDFNNEFNWDPQFSFEEGVKAFAKQLE